MSFNPALSEAEKEKGNNAIKQQNYRQAIHHYTAAIHYNAMDSTLYFNRALGFIKTGDFSLAVNDCNKALELNKDYLKCYERRALAFFSIQEFSKASEDAIKVLQLEPNKKEIREILDKSQNCLKAQRKVMKSTFECDSESEDQDFIDENLILFDAPNYVDKKIRIVEKVCESVSMFMKQGGYLEVIEKSLKGIHVLSELFTQKHSKIQRFKFLLVKKVIKSHVILMNFEEALQFISNFQKFEMEDVKDEILTLEARVLELQGNYQQSLQVLKQITSFHKHIPSTQQRLNFLINPNTPRFVPLFQPNMLESTLEKWNAQKENVNKLFKSQKFQEAIEEFEKIIKIVHQKYSEYQVLTDNRLREFIVKVLNNKAIAYSKINDFHRSSKECLKVFLVEAKNPKAAYCLGKNLKSLKFFDSAKKWLLFSLNVSPSKVVQDEIDDIEKSFIEHGGLAIESCELRSEQEKNDDGSEIDMIQKNHVVGNEEKIEENQLEDNFKENEEKKKEIFQFHDKSDEKEGKIIHENKVEVKEIIEDDNKFDKKEEVFNEDKVNQKEEIFNEDKFNIEKEKIIENEIESEEKKNHNEDTSKISNENKEPFSNQTNLKELNSQEIKDKEPEPKPTNPEKFHQPNESSEIPSKPEDPKNQPQEISTLLSSPSKSSSSVPSSQASLKPLDLSLAKKLATEEYESHFPKENIKYLLSNLSSIIQKKALSFHLKEIPSSMYSALTPQLFEIFPSLISELLFIQSSFEPWVSSFFSFSLSDHKVLKFLSKTDKNHLQEILVRLGDEGLLKLVNNCMNNRNIALTEWEIAGARIVNENIFRLARNGRVFEIQDLFRGGIDPDSMDKNGNTVLIIACQNNHKDLARLCLQFRADVNWKNNLGKNALDYARQYRYDRLRDYLVRKGAVSS